MTELLIKQNQQNPKECLTNKQNPPNWTYTPPTPQLEKKGLTSKTLQEIIENINQNAEKDFKDSYHPNFGYFVLFLSYIGMIAGFIIIVIGTEETIFIGAHSGKSLIWIGAATLILSVLLMAITYCVVSAFYKKAALFAMDNVKQYVEATLNEKYQKGNGIGWSIITEQTIS